MTHRRIIFASSLAIGIAAVFGSGSAFAANQCIPMISIDRTTVVDENTILVTLRTKNSFKRIDLAGPCPGLKFNGFIHKTSTNDLCSSDTLKVLEPVGQTCLIKDISDISPVDAKALQAKK